MKKKKNRKHTIYTTPIDARTVHYEKRDDCTYLEDGAEAGVGIAEELVEM